MSLVLILCLLPFSNGFSTRVSPTRQRHFSFSLSQSASYGRGAEIWPECNEEQIRLQDSFPGGKIPGSVMAALQQKDVGKTPEPSDGGLLSRVWGRTLSFNSVDRLPTVIALTLLLKGLFRPLDIMIVSAITGYTVILHSFARSTRDDGITPTVPALPPQGHVPDLVLNPLGLTFTNSDEYDTWLKSGVILSLFLPLAVIFRRNSHQMDAVRACARPLFLLCGQALGESLTRQFLVSLDYYCCVCRFAVARTHSASVAVTIAYSHSGSCLVQCGSFGSLDRLGTDPDRTGGKAVGGVELGLLVDQSVWLPHPHRNNAISEGLLSLCRSGAGRDAIGV